MKNPAFTQFPPQKLGNHLRKRCHPVGVYQVCFFMFVSRPGVLCKIVRSFGFWPFKVRCPSPRFAMRLSQSRKVCSQRCTSAPSAGCFTWTKTRWPFVNDPGGENREGHVDASGEGEAHDKFHTQGSWVVLEEWSLYTTVACSEYYNTTSHQAFFQYDFGTLRDDKE